MGKAIQFVVGGTTFPSKEAAKLDCRRRINAYTIGRTLNAEDADFFANLLVDHHHNPEGKIGPGVVRAYVAAGEKGTRGVRLTRVDGSDVDFSWTRCIYPKGDWTLFSSAARWVIEPQIHEFRDTAFAFGECPCSACNSVLRPHVTKHDVDHVAPLTFAYLLERFVEETSLEWRDVVLVDVSAEGGRKRTFSDTDLVGKWSSFHRGKAKLRLMCRTCHENTPRKGSS